MYMYVYIYTYTYIYMCMPQWTHSPKRPRVFIKLIISYDTARQRSLFLRITGHLFFFLPLGPDKKGDPPTFSHETQSRYCSPSV